MFTLFYIALVSFGKVTAEQKDVAESFGVAIYTWDEFLQLVGYLLHSITSSDYLFVYGGNHVNCSTGNSLCSILCFDEVLSRSRVKF